MVKIHVLFHFRDFYEFNLCFLWILCCILFYFSNKISKIKYQAFVTFDNFESNNCFLPNATESNLWKTNLSITSNLVLLMLAKCYVLSLMIKRFYADTHQYLAFKLHKDEET